MDENRSCPIVDNEDIRAALKKLGVYVDVTEEDLKAIFDIAYRHAQGRIVSGHPVRDVMNVRVVTVSAESSLGEAAKLLSDHKIRGMPVVDGGGRVTGVVSKKDLLCMAGMERGHSFMDIIRHMGSTHKHECRVDTTVNDVMTSPALTILELSSVGEAAKLMNDHDINRLPVVDDGGRLVGILTKDDIIRAVGGI